MPFVTRFGRSVLWVAPLALLGAHVSEARAHFLFVRIGEFAEGGRSAEVYFSEQAKAGDPRFIPKIAHTKLWVQTKPGEFRELKVQPGADRLRAAIPPDRCLEVIGECRYGVLARPKQTPFLLRHYPKAVCGSIEEVNRLTRRAETPFEIMATIDRKPTGEGSNERREIGLVALREGKPMPGVTFHAVDTDLVEVKFAARADGRAAWTPPSAGRYCFYVADTLKEAGELDGKHYDEVRDFATLTLEWPIETAKPDPEASALFEKAIAQRAQWKGFSGFSADISGELDGRAFSGKVTIAANGQVKLDVDDEAAKPWLEEQLESLVMHRLPASGNAELKFRFADEPDAHPSGRLLVVDGGRMASSYRIKNEQISVVNRNLGSRSMTLSVLSNEKNVEGRMLPAHFVVHYWDSDSGRLLRTETIHDRWTRVDRLDLPVSHTVTTASDGGMSIRTFTLSKHTLASRP